MAHVDNQKPKGVYDLKVHQVVDAVRTICSIIRFFNSDPNNRYAIRVFSDTEYTNETMHNLIELSDGVDIKIIVDTKRWHQLPESLTDNERQEVLKRCENFSTPTKAICTELKVGIGYAYMGYWRYASMAIEPALQEFDYFVSIDADAFLTPLSMTDPFRLMERNGLYGIFNIEAYQGGIKQGIQNASEALVPSVEKRKNRYLDAPKYEIFDDNGEYSEYRLNPSIWGCFFGGRLDFFQTEEYRRFACIMAPYTYIYRTNEQAVIAAAWSLLGDGEKVWYLPKRGVQMGIYHHGWVDNRIVVKLNSHENSTTTNETYRYIELDEWRGFSEIRNGLADWDEYVETMYGPSDDLAICRATTTK